jgi:hypothetical protein
LKLWVIPAVILLGIALLIKKDEILGYYDDVLVYYLNYLNLFDLICMYFEFGFSAMDTVKYCSRTCCKKDIYKLYIQGKLLYHKRKLYKEFEKEFNELKSITNIYAEDIQKYKLTHVFTFVTKHELILQKGYNSEQKPNNDSKPPIQNPTQFQLEKLISSPFANVKSLGRKITRINNIENREIKGVDRNKCCNKICSNFVVEVIKIFLFLLRASFLRLFFFRRSVPHALRILACAIFTHRFSTTNTTLFYDSHYSSLPSIFAYSSSYQVSSSIMASRSASIASVSP